MEREKKSNKKESSDEMVKEMSLSSNGCYRITKKKKSVADARITKMVTAQCSQECVYNRSYLDTIILFVVLRLLNLRSSSSGGGGGGGSNRL